MKKIILLAICIFLYNNSFAQNYEIVTRGNKTGLKNTDTGKMSIPFCECSIEETQESNVYSIYYFENEKYNLFLDNRLFLSSSVSEIITSSTNIVIKDDIDYNNTITIYDYNGKEINSVDHTGSSGNFIIVQNSEGIDIYSSTWDKIRSEPCINYEFSHSHEVNGYLTLILTDANYKKYMYFQKENQVTKIPVSFDYSHDFKYDNRYFIKTNDTTKFYEINFENLNVSLKPIQATDPIYTELEKEMDYCANPDTPIQFINPNTSSFTQFLANSIEYPEEAIDSGISGDVIVSFIIDTEGKMQHLQIIQGNPILAKEAERVMLLTQWSPAEKDGKKVKSISKQKIGFRLE